MTRNQVFVYILLLICITATGSFANKRNPNNHANEQINPVSSRNTHSSSEVDLSKHQNISSLKIESADSDDDVFLRIKSHMRNMNATSGDDIQFKCKVDGKPKKNIQYIWYHNNIKISSRRDRFIITSRPWGSKLLIKNLYTFDSGIYRCEASNGFRRVYSSARLKVSFERPPAPSEEEKVKINLPQGKCESYKGSICKEYFNEHGVFIEELEDQLKMEDFIQKAINVIADSPKTSTRCHNAATPAFCYYIFRPCVQHPNGDIQRGERLCREDCELLKRDVCNEEFLRIDSSNFLMNETRSSECSFLLSSASSQCKKQNFSQFENFADECYEANGENYRGNIHVSESGLPCERWPEYMVNKNPELLAGHNCCRNFNDLSEKPWCMVNDNGLHTAPCQIKQCETKDSSSLLLIVISCCCALLVFVGLLLFCCIRRHCRTKRNSNASKFSTSSQLQQGPMFSAQNTLTHLNASSIRILAEIGVGDYGKIYKGAIVDDRRFIQKQSYAIVSMEEMYLQPQIEDFKRDMEVMAQLQHPHITALKGVVLQPNYHCMVFEYTDQVDLHEYLVLNSPTRDGAKRMESNANGHAMSSIDNVDFMEMAVQISSGMHFLTTNNYIHRDLAARNVLVCGNMDLKICNLGVIRDSYLASYYKPPQGKLLPIRWMAPESLHSWKFSDKSTVWSFGVVVWEMFSYGLQPYCGYSNHEVLDMISRRQLLSCPDHCPAKIYSLLQECWNAAPKHRPTFQEIEDKLRLSMEAGEVMIVKSAYLNRDRIGTPSPPPEYRSHCPNHVASWNGNYASSEQSYSSALLTGRHSGATSGSYHQYHQATGRLQSTNSFASCDDIIMANV